MSLTNKQEKYLSVNNDGRQIYYQEYGNPEGIPILMIHGGAGYTIDPEKMSAFDPKKYNIITWHQRGVGNSQPYLPEDNTIQTHVDDAEALRKHLGIEQWNVFSWSFGTIIATLYALQNPERCVSLSSYAPYLAGVEDWDVVFTKENRIGYHFMEVFGGDTLPESIARAHTLMREAGGKEESIFILYRIDSHVRHIDMTWEDYRVSKTEAEWDRAITDALIDMQIQDEAFNKHPEGWLYDMAKDNTAFQAIPTTLIFGQNDRVVAPNSNVDRVYPNAAQHTISEAGHNVHEPFVQRGLAQIFGSGMASMLAHVRKLALK